MPSTTPRGRRCPRWPPSIAKLLVVLVNHELAFANLDHSGLEYGLKGHGA